MGERGHGRRASRAWQAQGVGAVCLIFASLRVEHSRSSNGHVLHRVWYEGRQTAIELLLYRDHYTCFLPEDENDRGEAKDLIVRLLVDVFPPLLPRSRRAPGGHFLEK